MVILSSRQAAWLGALLAVAASGCVHHRLDASDVRDVQRLAIVVRVVSGPVGTDAQLQKILAKQVEPFEMEERLRAALVSKLPAAPPWSTAMSAADVATVLQSLLVVDRPSQVDYVALERAGADSVLELKVTSWGVTNGAKPALFLKGDGRLFWLPNGSRLWTSSLDIDLGSDPEVDAADLDAIRNGGFRDAVRVLVDKLADRLAYKLAPSP